MRWEKGLPVWYDGRTGFFCGKTAGKGTEKMNKAEQSARLAEGRVIRLPVRRMGINGEGIGYFQKKVVFVEGAIPGETVLARVFEEERQYARARLLRVLKPSPRRRKTSVPRLRGMRGVSTAAHRLSLSASLEKGACGGGFFPLHRPEGSPHRPHGGNGRSLAVPEQGAIAAEADRRPRENGHVFRKVPPADRNGGLCRSSIRK